MVSTFSCHMLRAIPACCIDSVANSTAILVVCEWDSENSTYFQSTGVCHISAFRNKNKNRRDTCLMNLGYKINLFFINAEEVMTTARVSKLIL